ncbi:MAG: hypothetical protein SFW09_10670 [Hyphomicrobiaceae bacterium]|nr:hypothetical protein [Hyphomicrobiaceae bacterium]
MTSTRFGLKLVFATGAAIVLLWLIATRSLVAYLAETAPDLALGLNPKDPIALLNVAEKTIAAAESEHQKALAAGSVALPVRMGAGRFAPPAMSDSKAEQEILRQATLPPSDARAVTNADLKAARQMIELALTVEPLSSRAWSMLGRISDLGPPEATADTFKYYTMAARLSLRESRAIWWLMQRSVETQDYSGALLRADQLLRTNSRAGPLVFPVLAQMAETPQANTAVKALLARNPPWRRQFLVAMVQSIRDARTPLDVMLALKEAGSELPTSEVAGYLSFLVSRNLHQLAYYAWLQFLSPDQLASTGLLFNGSFEQPLSGLVFDWTVSQGAGTLVQFPSIPGEAGKHALRIDFTEGRVQFGGVTQLVMLAPGAYVLRGRHKGEIVGKRGLRWRVTCVAPKRNIIGETPMHLGPAPLWRGFEIEFTVPPDGCEAQQIQLILDARSTSEQLVRGTMWYDDLVIARAVGPAAQADR